MGGRGGLIELVLVFAAVLGWGLLELRATKREGRKIEAEKKEADR